jgi:primary-amine oxidase
MGRTAAQLCRGGLVLCWLAIHVPPALPAEPGAPRHPLDALIASEYWTIFEAMKGSGHVDTASRYAGITLHEPPKTEVLAWKPGQPFRREALVVVKQGRRTFEAVVDVRTSKVAAWKEIRGVEPNVIQEEQDGIEEQLKHNAEWLAAIRRRGITNLDTVGCDGGSPGYFDTAEEKGRRLLRVTCADSRGAMHSN